MASTTPTGRRTVNTLDPLGRVIQVQAPGVLPLQVQYDSRGRHNSVTQGARVCSYAYDSLGNLASLTDPLGRQVSFGYDIAGRPTRQVLPDGRAIAMSYDANGNLTSVTPPGRPAHNFAYTPVDLDQMLGGKRYLLVKDPVGSIREVAEATAGSIVERMDYDEFGNVLVDSAPGN